MGFSIEEEVQVNKIRYFVKLPEASTIKKFNDGGILIKTKKFMVSMDRGDASEIVIEGIKLSKEDINKAIEKESQALMLRTVREHEEEQAWKEYKAIEWYMNPHVLDQLNLPFEKTRTDTIEAFGIK